MVRPQDIKISLADFINAMNMIVPSSHRMNVNYSRSLLLHLKPLLGAITDSLYQNVTSIMPNTAPQEEAHNANDDGMSFISLPKIRFSCIRFGILAAVDPISIHVDCVSPTIAYLLRSKYFRDFCIGSCSRLDMCQAEIVADLLHRLESLPIHNIDMASLHRCDILE